MGFFHDHSAGEALKILCVDDDLATCQLYGEYGNILDWVVYQTTTVPAALDVTSTRRFDAIVVDQSIGTDTGIDLIREIRRNEGPNQHAPFLMCTVYDMQEMADALNRLNVEAFLQKPISLSRFEHAVLSLMDERQFTLDLEQQQKN
jgi:Response regulator containing CheY-like receiver, AAA-type ATPase, and DNA-binding domains